MLVTEFTTSMDPPFLYLFLAGNFLPGGENGTIMKKSDENERNALNQLLYDSLRNFVPEFKREVEHSGHGEVLLRRELPAKPGPTQYATHLQNLELMEHIPLLTLAA